MKICLILFTSCVTLVLSSPVLASEDVNEILFRIDFEDHPVGLWGGAYNTTSFPRKGFAHVVSNADNPGNHYAEIRPGFTENGGTLDQNWRGFWFNTPIPFLMPGQALELSFDCRLFLNDEVSTARLFDLFVVPSNDVALQNELALKGLSQFKDRLGFEILQSNWDKGGTTLDGNLLIHMQPVFQSKIGININLNEMGVFHLGQADSDINSDELRFTYTLRKSEKTNYWQSRLEVFDKVTGGTWHESREFVDKTIYHAPGLITGFYNSSTLKKSGVELDNILCRMVQLDSPFVQELPDEKRPEIMVSVPDWSPIDPDTIPLLSIPRIKKQIQQEIQQLKQGLEILPGRQEPLQFDSYGYHGGYLPRLDELPNVPRWVVDVYFPSDRLEELVLVPAFDRRFDQTASYGFPRRFRVLLLEGNGDFHLIQEWLEEDFVPTDRMPVILDVPYAKPSHNRIRIEVYRGAWENQRELFALDEVYGVAINEICQAETVTVTSELKSPPYWAKEYLIDQKTHLGLPVGPAAEPFAQEDFKVILDENSEGPYSIELDLGQNRTLGWITLFPATPIDGILIPGYGFPGDIKVELIPERQKGVRGLTSYLPEGWHGGAPANNVVRIPMYSNSARWIRLVCSDLPVHNGELTFALGEVHVYKGEQTHAVKKVSLDGFPLGAEKDAGLLIDGLAHGKPVMFLMSWLHQLTEQQRLSGLLTNRINSQEQLKQRWGTWGRVTTLTLLALLAASALIVTIISIIQKRRSFYAMNFRVEQERHQTEIEQMKIRFFTHISHELRTPLTVILGPLEKLVRSQKDPQVTKPVSMALRNVKKLQGLVDQLLDFRKLQDGRETLTCRDTDISQYMRNGFDVYRSMAVDKQIDYRLSLPDTPQWLSIDTGKFQKIVDNLISNALKYTPANGMVMVTLSLREGSQESSTWLKLVVEDSGTGIASEDLSHVFEQYYRAEGESSKASGSGIGLALVKELVDLMKGSVSVESPVHDNQGTRFTVQIPVETISSPQVISESSSLEFSADTKDEDHSCEVEAKDMGGGGEQDHIPPKVLIIDDHIDIRTFLASELCGTYTVIEAKDGLEGLTIIQQEMPDLIISDIMMPVMNGIELCRRIKTDEVTSHIPVILLTARGSIEHQVEGLETGADDYVSKPFSMPVLQQRIHNLLESRRILRERFRREITVEPSAITVTSADERFLQRAIAVVEEGMGFSEFDVEAFAAKMHMSRRNMHIKLKALVDQGPQEFIRVLRLKRAKQLLEQGADQIAQVAFQVGFEEPANFTRSFKRQFGVSPSEFRKGLGL